MHYVCQREYFRPNLIKKVKNVLQLDCAGLAEWLSKKSRTPVHKAFIENLEKGTTRVRHVHGLYLEAAVEDTVRKELKTAFPYAADNELKSIVTALLKALR